MLRVKTKYITLLIATLFVIFLPVTSNSAGITEFEVKKGDTLSGIIRSAGISSSDAANAIAVMKGVYNPGKIKIGDKIRVFSNYIQVDGQRKPSLLRLDIQPSKLERFEIKRVDEKSFNIYFHEIPTSKRLVKSSGKINTTLFGATRKAGIPFDVGSDFVRKYSYDVDFQRDIRKGNSFDILYEEVITPNGEVVGTGDIVYANLNLNKESFKIYRFKTLDGRYGYYNQEGQSIEKSFLRTPVDGARITSGFGKRRHPILGYNKMHKGLDFGAPRGTPIYAAGSGYVSKIGRNGSYGNYIRINHSNGYSTAYAHLKKFKRGLRKRSRVKQGQIIGYVGTTGRSTGPHLHYEVLRGGRQINPLSIKTVAINSLKSLEMGIYSQHVKMVEREVAKVDAKNKVAVLEID